MIRKIKSNVKSSKLRESSLLDFVREIKENSKVVTRGLKKENKRGGNIIREQPLTVDIGNINGHLRDAIGTQRNKTFAEDKENMNLKMANNSVKPSLRVNESIKNYFKPVNSVRVLKSVKSVKMYKVDFFDEMNKRNVRMDQYQEEDIEFTQSKVLPKVKMMKVDNDVMTDPEQVEDASKMMRDNLKMAIKLIQESKEIYNYLNKNLSRKIKFVKTK